MITTIYLVHLNLSDPKRTPLLVIDIDGTLYDGDCDVEDQIIVKTQNFAKKFGYNKVECKIFL
jgi:hypothetical protein